MSLKSQYTLTWQEEEWAQRRLFRLLYFKNCEIVKKEKGKAAVSVWSYMKYDSTDYYGGKEELQSEATF